MTDPGQRQPEKATLRQIVNTLLDIADRLPRGLDTAAEFGICDGTGLQMLNTVDVSSCSVFPRGSAQPARGPVVLIRAHDHGNSRGQLMRGVIREGTAHADEKLRHLTGQDPTQEACDE